MLEDLTPFGEGLFLTITLAYSGILAYTFLEVKERLLFMCTGLSRPYDEWFP